MLWFVGLTRDILLYVWESVDVPIGLMLLQHRYENMYQQNCKRSELEISECVIIVRVTNGESRKLWLWEGQILELLSAGAQIRVGSKEILASKGKTSFLNMYATQ